MAGFAAILWQTARLNYCIRIIQYPFRHKAEKNTEL